jgi:hypothetical protein
VNSEIFFSKSFVGAVGIGLSRLVGNTEVIANIQPQK